MAIMKPSIFIGSSSEALALAKAIQTDLLATFDTYLWADNLFDLGEDNLNNLLRLAQCHDFAVLVLSGDDVTKSRNRREASPRDNVVFELGLFMGALGRRRSFPVVAKTANGSPKLPSDLFGNTVVYISNVVGDSLDPVALSKELRQLRETIDQRSRESALQLLPSTGLAIGYFQNFVLPVCQELANRDTVKVNGAEIDITQDNFDFTVVLPATLSDASIQGARKFAKLQKAEEFALRTASRSFPFYVNTALQNGRVVFYDFPTTLRASHEAIRIALAGPYLGKGDYHLILDNKEIRNFERTLRILLEDAGAAEFRDKVKVLQLR